MIARKTLEEHDYAMTIGDLAVILVVLVSSPANYFPFKSTLYYIAFGNNNVSTLFNFICTTIFCTLTAVISIVFPQIHSALSITGGFSSVNMCYIVPLVCYLKLSKEKWYKGFNLFLLIFFSVLSVIGWISVIVTIYQIINPPN